MVDFGIREGRVYRIILKDAVFECMGGVEEVRESIKTGKSAS